MDETGSTALQWTCEKTDGMARAGSLTTPHGSIATPTFMAVGTQAALKGISVQQAENIGQGILLANTYHLALRPGAELVRQLGGLHTFCGWQGPMLTDSGGYQVFSLAANRRIDEEGVRFRSHIDGSPFALSPERSIAIQRQLGADMIMAFDECPDAQADKDYQVATMHRTLRWLDRSREAWLAVDGLPGGPQEQALFGIIQGGLHKDLREESTRETAARQLPGIAIGGLSVGETAAEREAVLDWVAPLLPTDRPHYLMGVGTPLDLVEAVVRGIDMFDCVLPTRMGRHGIAYTDDGPLRLKRAEYADDPHPIDDRINSEASRVSRAYLRHLLKAGEHLGGALISIHNLAYYQDLMRRLREAILAGELDSFATAYRHGYTP